MKQFDLDTGLPVLIMNAGGEFFACQAFCPHEQVKLEDGVHDGSIITCLEHLWQFDLRTGAPVAEADCGLESYRLKQEGGELHVWIENAK
jgi:toluene monooxygenase system ferredoxin subunit